MDVRPHSIPHILNMSFDKEFQVQTVELLGYDPLVKNDAGDIVGGLKRITTNAMGEYAANDIEESGNLTYVGKEDSAGDWFIQKIDSTSGKSIRYASTKNNLTVTSYSDAWNDRASLTYGTYSQAF